MIVLKIDVSKIDKTKLFKGAKGTYLDAVLIETPNNQYGDTHMIVQSVSKEEREKGIKGAILGNAKTLNFDKNQSGNNTAPKVEDLPDDDLPF